MLIEEWHHTPDMLVTVNWNVTAPGPPAPSLLGGGASSVVLRHIHFRDF
jgi:hypothetical protein